MRHKALNQRLTNCFCSLVYKESGGTQGTTILSGPFAARLRWLDSASILS